MNTLKEKRVLGFVASLLVSGHLFAGGYLTNTNQNAAFGRNLSQEAMIDVLATYANPAGVAFLSPGWHLAISNQSAFQTREAESWFVNPDKGPFAIGIVNGDANGSATKTFKGKAVAPIIPSVDLAYVQDKWSLAFHFGVIGGGGKCEFEDGLGSFESKVALLPTVLNTLTGTSKVKGYAMDTYMRGRQYYFGGQINGTYKVMPNLSVAAGLRLVYASCNYYGYVSNMKAVMADGSQVPVADYLTPVATSIVTSIPQMAPIMAQLSSVAGDVRLNCDQTGWGVTPIIGVDWKINDHWNVAAKYEFKTRLRLKNESGESSSGSALAELDEFADGEKVEADIPAILYVGAQYSPIQQLRLNLGGHIYFDKQATQFNHREKELDGQGWEITAGVEYDLNERLTLSAGWQNTNYGLGDDSKFITDMSFVTNSNSVGVGARFKVSKKVAIDVSYFKTFYKHYDKDHADYNNVKENFSNLLTPMEGQVTQIAQGIIADDISKSINPASDPRVLTLQSLGTSMNTLKAAPTIGSDRLCRTNDVFGVGVVVDF